MKNRSESPIYIKGEECVNLDDSLIEEAVRLQDNPELMLAIIDLMYLDREESIPS